MLLFAFVCSLFIGASAQGVPPRAAGPAGGPPRDAIRPSEPSGTSAIKGRVVAADTGNPIRRANVTLIRTVASQASGRGAVVTGTQVPPSGRQIPPEAFTRPRQATTNTQGVFEFTGLPAGTYRVIVSGSQYTPQYLGIAYGAKRPNGPFSSDMGQSISVTDGETFSKAVVQLPRGAVITGHVMDESSQPLALVQVYVVFYPPGSARGQRTGPSAQTDDLGQFRLFGLVPGDYVVVAEARRNNFSEPNAPQETEEDKIGFLTTYYPGTTDEGGAERVRARAGAETSGIEIRLGEGRLFRVSGSVVDSQGRPAARVVGQLTRRVPGFNGGSSFGFSTDEQGRFQMRDLPPGDYRLMIQPMRQFGSPRGPANDADPGEMAVVPLTIAGDLENVVVMTLPGATITGRLVLEEGTASPSGGPMRVMATPGNPSEWMGMQTPPAVVGPDLTFTMKGLMGESLLRVAAPNLYVKSVVLDGNDVTDTPREFKTNDRVVITLTSRSSTLEGTVVDGKGGAAAEAGVIVFSEERSSWRMSSTRTRRGIVDGDGHFRVPGLMPGRYLVVALPRERLMMVGGAPDASFFELLSKDAVAVVIGEDEQRRVDLKVAEGGAGAY